MADLLIRAMSREDVQAVARLEKECFSTPWSESQLLYEVNENTSVSRFLIALSDDIPVGYIGCYLVLDEGGLTNLAVTESFRKKGAATALISALCSRLISEGASFLTLEVRRSNFAAISLYKKLGFLQVGIRKSFYEAPEEDALLFTKYFREDNPVEDTCI